MKALPTPFLLICVFSIFSHFWIHLNLSARKMDVTQVLAGEEASVNSLFHIWGLSFSSSGWGNLMSLGVFPHPGQTQPVLLCSSALHNLILFLLVFNTQVQLWGPSSASTCQYPPLETGPCSDSKSPSRGSRFFSLRTQETVKVSWKGKLLCQEKEVQTPSVSAFKAGPVVSTWCFLCHFINHLPTGLSKCGQCWTSPQGTLGVIQVLLFVRWL